MNQTKKTKRANQRKTVVQLSPEMVIKSVRSIIIIIIHEFHGDTSLKQNFRAKVHLSKKVRETMEGRMYGKGKF